jgi:plastocyanin
MVGALGLVLAGCGGGGGQTGAAPPAGESAAPSGGAEEQAQTASIVGLDYAFSGAPEQLKAGVVELTFENQGRVAHEVALVAIGDTPLDQFLQDFPPVLEGGPFPAYATHVAVPIEAPPGETVPGTFTLPEGNYALFCALEGDAEAAATAPPAEGGEEPTGPAHYTRGMAQTLTVGAGQADAAVPEADGSITAFDYGFETDIQAGDTGIAFTNTGPAQVHFAAVSVFPEGTDVAAAEEGVRQLLSLPQDQPPPEGATLPEDVGFSGVYSNGLGGVFQVPGGFQSGRTYLLICFVQDRTGGPPHAIANNMFKVFTVE